MEAPKAGSLPETIVKIPYPNAEQILGNGQISGLNVGAIVTLPEGFKVAPKKISSEELEEKMKGVYISPYSSTQENSLVVGPIQGERNQDIEFPISSPDPQTNKKVSFLKYPIESRG